jgi:transposase
LISATFVPGIIPGIKHGSYHRAASRNQRIAANIARIPGLREVGRSYRLRLTSKIHAVVDANGLPVRLALTPGEAHDNRLAGKLLSRLKSGSMLLADRGYDADWIRGLAKRRGAWANIPPKRNRNDPICFSPYLYRDRNRIERFFNRIKQCRRVATRYDKLAANYLAFVQLASIRLWLRAYESTP